LHGFGTIFTPNYFAYTAEDLEVKYYSYSNEFTKEMKYLSDSSGIWREGCCCKHLGNHDRFQILTHPEWWFDHDEGYDKF
jgi:hypothetical protein